MLSEFRPASGLRHPHLQTILAKYLSPRYTIHTRPERLPLADGDELQLNWLLPAQQHAHAPLLLLLHGLAGNINSHYIQAMLAQCQAAGWPAVLMHFRGCHGKPNKLARAYHSGDTADLAQVLTYIAQRQPQRKLMAVGYSLGANVLVKYCGEQATANPLSAAVAVCPPLSLSACAVRINQGFSKLYQRYLLQQLKSTTLDKLQQHQPFPLPLTAQQLTRLNTIEQFDNCYTAPIHGFADSQDYYRQASGKAYLKHIAVPTLVIHAKDDPFLSDDVIPTAAELSPSVQYQLTTHGGHVGFISGSLLAPHFWLSPRIMQFLQEQV